MASRPTAAASEALSAENAELARQISALRADVDRLTAALGDSATGPLLAQIQAYLAQAKAAAETAVDGKLANAGAMVDEATAFAKAKPLQALGLAAGVGMVLGLLFGRR
jgi:ElaB/YqjD/DUF883 family membrane-anchored ribosome-binding protein